MMPEFEEKMDKMSEDTAKLFLGLMAHFNKKYGVNLNDILDEEDAYKVIEFLRAYCSNVVNAALKEICNGGTENENHSAEP